MKKILMQIFFISFLALTVPAQAYLSVIIVNNSKNFLNEFCLYVYNAANRSDIIPAVLGKNIHPGEKKTYVFGKIIQRVQNKQNSQNTSKNKNSYTLTFHLVQINNHVDPAVPENGLSEAIQIANLDDGLVTIIIDGDKITASSKTHEAKISSLINGYIRPITTQITQIIPKEIPIIIKKLFFNYHTGNIS